MSFRYAIFDMDGTLLDSMPVWDTVGDVFLERHGYIAPADLGERMRDMSIEQAARYFVGELGVSMPIAQIMEELNGIPDEQYRYHVPLKPGVLPFLQMLHSAGVKMCVATATDASSARLAFRRLGVLDLFEFVLSCNDVGRGKNDPLLYNTCAGRLGAAPEDIVIFEDALYCIKTAKQAGFYVVGVSDPSSEGDQAEIMALSDRFVRRLDQAADLWQKNNG